MANEAWTVAKAIHKPAIADDDGWNIYFCFFLLFLLFIYCYYVCEECMHGFVRGWGPATPPAVYKMCVSQPVVSFPMKLKLNFIIEYLMKRGNISNFIFYRIGSI